MESRILISRIHQDTNMALPPLYKYLGVQGAKLTLGNRAFKHAKPSDFNDTEDLTIQSIFPEDTEEALKKLEGSFTDVILQHLNDAPTCDSPLKEKVALIQDVYRKDPKAAELVKAEKEGLESVYDVEHMRARAVAHIKEINDFMQDYRVLCVTTLNASDEMWASYAEQHRGIALRIEPNVAKDSKFQLFRAVVYRDKRPSFYEDTLDFIAGSLFGDQAARRNMALEKIVYTKTLKWRRESEYRLAIPMRQGEPSWNTLPFHPEEITELYLGLAMEKADLDEILRTARGFNPGIAVFQMKRRQSGRLGYNRLH